MEDHGVDGEKTRVTRVQERSESESGVLRSQEEESSDTDTIKISEVMCMTGLTLMGVVWLFFKTFS